MGHGIAPLAVTAPVGFTPVPVHAASDLMTQHGRGSLAEAIRNGMNAKRQGDNATADFWCGVCAALVRMLQADPAQPA